MELGFRSVVIADSQLAPADAFALFDQCTALDAAPALIVTARRSDESEEARAAGIGALGYLPKPVHFADFVRLLRRRKGLDDRVAPRARGSAIVHAVAVDPGYAEPLFCWEIVDISVTRALLVAHSEFPIGAQRTLELAIGELLLVVRASVVRVQPPSWVAVRFLDLCAEARVALEAYAHRAAR